MCSNGYPIGLTHPQRVTASISTLHFQSNLESCIYSTPKYSNPLLQSLDEVKNKTKTREYCCGIQREGVSTLEAPPKVITSLYLGQNLVQMSHLDLFTSSGQSGSCLFVCSFLFLVTICLLSSGISGVCTCIVRNPCHHKFSKCARPKKRKVNMLRAEQKVTF